MKVLLVEDDPVDAMLVTEALKGAGIDDVVRAESGEAALDRLGARSDLVMLLDVRLPGLSGHDVLARLRERGVTAPVVMMSSSTRDEDIAAAYRNGAAAYFKKPADIDAYSEVAEAVRRTWFSAGLSQRPR